MSISEKALAAKAGTDVADISVATINVSRTKAPSSNTKVYHVDT